MLTTDLNRYSPIFQTLHDEPKPVGRLLDGTHYSVLRSATWHTPSLERRTEGAYHDFSIIWDRDHDPRIVQVLENIYFAGLLAPVLFAGERKGDLTLWVDEQTPMARNPSAFQARVLPHAHVAGDYWTCSVVSVAEPDYLVGYLEFVRMLWSLGHHARESESSGATGG